MSPRLPALRHLVGLPGGVLRRLRNRMRSRRIRWDRSDVRIEEWPDPARSAGEGSRPREDPVEGTSPAPGGPGFDGAKAFALLKDQCDFGSRACGTDGHRRAESWLAERLAVVVDDLLLVRWSQAVDRGVAAGRAYDMTSFLALVRSEADRGRPRGRVRAHRMLSAHWDTRPAADADPDPARRGEPVPGANDGASGVAVVLEAARALRTRRPPRTVALALWDGEDLGEHFYGSRLFADLADRPELTPWRAGRGVVVDMVGGRELSFTREANSMRVAPDVWAELVEVAGAVGEVGRFEGGASAAVGDDHLFLCRAGIPTALLIQWPWPRWHTTGDTPELCAPDSLEAAGRIVLHWLRLSRG